MVQGYNADDVHGAQHERTLPCEPRTVYNLPTTSFTVQLD